MDNSDWLNRLKRVSRDKPEETGKSECYILMAVVPKSLNADSIEETDKDSALFLRIGESFESVRQRFLHDFYNSFGIDINRFSSSVEADEAIKKVSYATHHIYDGRLVWNEEIKQIKFLKSPPHGSTAYKGGQNIPIPTKLLENLIREELPDYTVVFPHSLSTRIS